MSTLRWQVKRIYKELLFLGRDYPRGYGYFQTRLHDAFTKKAHLADEDDIRVALEQAYYLRKEIEALYYVKRYRALKQRYDSEP